MSERREREDRRGVGWFSILTIAVIVIAAGFSVGIVAGLAWEEPGLVLGYMAGDTDAIEWRTESGAQLAEASPPETPPVAAAPPRRPSARSESTSRPLGAARPAAPISPSPKPPPEPAKRATTRPVSKPAPPAPAARTAAVSTGFAVQVGAFGERASAQRLADRLRGNGYPVYVSGAGEGQGSSWRVRVGPLPTREEAERVAGRLKQGEKLPTWVLSEAS